MLLKAQYQNHESVYLNDHVHKFCGLTKYYFGSVRYYFVQIIIAVIYIGYIWEKNCYQLTDNHHFALYFRVYEIPDCKLQCYQSVTSTKSKHSTINITCAVFNQ